MDANILNLTRVFELNRRYVVPLFQRPYVWKQDTHWRPLWEDIENVADRVLAGETPRAHFIGAVVLEQQRTAASELDCRVVIDGQQRLTTLQLVLEALADACAVRKLDRVHARLVKLTRNDDAFAEQADERFKVWPTTSDQDAFRRVMNQSTATGVRQEFPNGHETGISGAFVFFSDAVDEWLESGGADPAQRAEALYKALREYIRLVVIDLTPEDDAQAIFETLNARGEPLRPSDLVKNVLLQRARDERADLDSAYQEYWKRFDDEAAFWSEDVGRGRSARPRIDVFLQHFLSAQQRKEVAVAHLYAEFRDYLRERPRSALEHLDSLASYAATYAGFESMDADDPLERYFRRVKILEVGTAYPFLLELLQRHGDALDEIQPALAALDSFLVRRMVCHLNTRGYNRFFLELLQSLDAPSNEVGARVIGRLLEGKADSNRWPSDAEFRQAWVNEPIYERQRQPRVRMLLETVEQQLHSEHTEAVAFRESLTIEHILPQEWAAQWPLPPGAPPDAALARDRVLHSLGNLTLLTSTLNPTVSNSAWPVKRRELEKHSVLMLNRQVIKEPSWSEQEIRNRGEALFDVALRVWPRPGDPRSAVAAPAQSPPASASVSLPPRPVPEALAAPVPQTSPSNRSTVASPVRLVWAIAEEMTAKNPAVTRKAIIEACVARGVTYWTASTQCSAWRASRRGGSSAPAVPSAPALAAGERDYASSRTTVDLVEALRALGLNDARFRRLHHFPSDRDPERSRLNDHVGYCMRQERFVPEGTNVNTARRLEACLARLRAGASWDDAIREAVQRFPIPGR